MVIKDLIKNINVLEKFENLYLRKLWDHNKIFHRTLSKTGPGFELHAMNGLLVSSIILKASPIYASIFFFKIEISTIEIDLV